MTEIFCGYFLLAKKKHPVCENRINSREYGKVGKACQKLSKIGLIWSLAIFQRCGNFLHPRVVEFKSISSSGALSQVVVARNSIDNTK